METTKKRSHRFFIAALLSFLFLCLDVILALLESKVYGVGVADFSHSQLMVHWIIIIILWLLSALAVIFYGRRYCDYSAFKTQFKPTRSALLCGIGIPVLCIIALTLFIGRPGFVNYLSNAPDLAAFQYTYYILEMLLAALLLSFAQKGFDSIGVNPMIPTGGMTLAVSWGLIHCFTKSSWSVALIAVALAMVFGVIHNLLGKDLRRTWPVMYLLFIWF